jgi:putative mRNA 3-end processing factor
MTASSFSILFEVQNNRTQVYMKFEKTGYHGLYFPDLKISLDGYHPCAEAVFVSHAHADHMPRNRSAKVITTPPTLDFMKRRGFRGAGEARPFGKIFENEQCRVRFYPAGHILGSAMIFIEWDSDSLLYTGDYRIPPSPASEGFEAPDHAGILITEATFALPIYRWKPYGELTEEIQNFAQNSLDDGFTPIFLGYNLGKAQELMHLLAPLGHPVMIHKAGYNLCDVYEKHGIDLGNYSAFDPNSCKGKILIAPSSALSKGFASSLSKTRIAYCSGWAANESRRTQLTADTLIPLSDHLDFFELIRFCKALSPRKVFITHTPNPAVVEHYLSNEGIDNSFLGVEAGTEA